MIAPRTKQRQPRKAPGGRSKAAGRKPPQPSPDRSGDAEQIERAVYDGMQDLRANRR